MCPCDAKLLLFGFWPADILAWKALGVGDRLVVWQGVDALRNLVNSSQEYSVVYRF